MKFVFLIIATMEYAFNALCAGVVYWFVFPVASSLLQPFSGGQWLVCMVIALVGAFYVFRKVAEMVVLCGSFLSGIPQGRTHASLLSAESTNSQSLAQRMEWAENSGDLLGRHLSKTYS